MEQGSRLDSTPVSAGHDTKGRAPGNERRDAAITKMLTAGATRDAAGRFAKRSAVPQPASDLGEVARKEVAPRGTVPAPIDAPEGTYGLAVRDDSLGLHAAPGASILVAPEVPAGAGLAVFYLKDASGPVIYDLTHGFRPEFARPFAPGSEVVPAIEVVHAGTGRSGRLRADHIEKIHRVLGVYTPAEIAAKHRIAPPPLPVMSECPEGMGEHYVDDTVAYPLVRRGETVVYDPSRREPTHGALCVLQWNNGTRDVMLTNQRTVGGVAGKWWVDPVNRPANREALERQISSGSVGILHVSDGPYDVDHLRGKIVGTVVGILVPRRPPIPPSGDTAPGSDRAAAAALATAVTKDTIAAIGTALDDVGLNSEVSEEICAAIEDHAEAIAAGRAETDDSDEAFDRHAAHEIATDKALREAPVRSLADLRAKLTYLVPIMAPDMLDQTHVAHLKAIRDDVDRLCRQPVAAADQRAASTPDPIFAAIEEAWRLTREHGRLLDLCAAHPDAHPFRQPEREAHAAMWGHVRNVVLKTVPATSQGCTALARFAVAFTKDQGVPLGDGDDGNDPVLELIARSADAANHIPAALGEGFDAAHAHWREAVEADREPSERYQAAIKEAQARGGPTVEEYEAAWKLDGVKRAHDAEDTASATVAELSLDILRQPARSVADLAVQARAVIPHVWVMGTYEADAALAPDEDIDKEAVRLLIESCCAAAGLDWRGKPRTGAPVSPSLPDTVTDDYARAFHHAIGEHRLAVRDFTGAINPADDEWVEQNGGDASVEAMARAVAAREAANKREFQAWRDLFKVRPRTWHHLSILLEHVAEHFDDHQGMMDEPDVFGALIGAVNGLRLASQDLTATHDLSSLSFNHLEYLSDICRQQARILQAYEQNHSETPFGVVLDREATRVAILGDQASDEIERRRPTTDDDRNFRLEVMIKGQLAGNGYIEPALLAEAVAAWGTR